MVRMSPRSIQLKLVILCHFGEYQQGLTNLTVYSFYEALFNREELDLEILLGM